MPPEEAVRSALPKPCLSQPPLEGRPLTLRIQTFDAMRSVSSAVTPLSRVRKYIRHKCKAKRRRDNKAREFYRKERCAQLRSHANQKLNAMLAQQESLSKGREITGKRPFTEDGRSGPDKPFQFRRMATIDSDANRTLQSKDHLPAAPLNNVPISAEPTSLSSLPSHLDGPATPSGRLSNAKLLLSFHGINASSNFAPGRTSAPILHGATIPPFYPQMFSFPSNMPHGSYSEISLGSLGWESVLGRAIGNIGSERSSVS